MAKQYSKLREAQKNLVDKQVLLDIEENNIGAANNRIFRENSDASEALEEAYDKASGRVSEIERNNSILKDKKKNPKDPFYQSWEPAPIPLVDEAKINTLRDFIERRREELSSPQSIAQLQATEATRLQQRIEFLRNPLEVTMTDNLGGPVNVTIPPRSEKEVREMAAQEFKNFTKRLNQLEQVNELRDRTNPNANLPKRQRTGQERD